MSIVLRGYVNDTILVRGFTKQTFTERLIVIFLQSNVYKVTEAISRIF